MTPANDSTSNQTVTINLSWDALNDRALVKCSNCGRISTYSSFVRNGCGLFSDNYAIEVSFEEAKRAGEGRASS